MNNRRYFWVGFIVATLLWFLLLNSIDIPEYTIERRVICT